MCARILNAAISFLKRDAIMTDMNSLHPSRRAFLAALAGGLATAAAVRPAQAAKVQTKARIVMIGAGAKILGNIEVGEGAKIGSCSVVLQAVPPHTTVAGVPAKIVGRPKTDKPSLDMDQGFNGKSQSFIHGDGI